LPEIVGVDEEKVGITIKELFQLLGKHKEIAITDTKTAEAAKIFTNMYRYVNFALANEFAIISEKLYIDAREAISLANMSYPRSRIPMPGPAAGPCLRKDGLFLSNAAAINLIKNAWLLNESVPLHIVETIEQHYGVLHGKKVGVLGKTYKANIDDMRDSPANRLIEELALKGAEVVAFDPFVTNLNTLEEVLNSEIVILAVNHSHFDKITVDMLKSAKIVYDVWGQFSRLDLDQYGVEYITLGRGIRRV
jgi:UDP-N-acetyl-D-mannosaminuronic acid dehydrogenase